MTDRVESTYMSTPVENLFIDEFLGAAPADYVKVYLYGLRFALYPLEQDMSLEQVARALHMLPETVGRAITYWQERHIIRQLQPGTFKLCYLSVQQGLLQGHADETAYRYKDFNVRLQNALGASRIIKPEEFQTVYGWLDELDMAQEAAIALILYFINNRHNIAFATMDRRVRVMVQDYQIHSLAEVQEYLEKGAPEHPAKEILAQWGIMRSVTMPERELYNRWVNEWGMEPASILAAAKSLIYLRNPNFKGLEKVINEMHQQGVTQSAAAQDFFDQQSLAGELAQRLGCSAAAVTEAMPNWLALGFNAHTLNLLAQELARETHAPSLGAMDALAQTLGKGGMTTAEDIAAYGQQFHARGMEFAQLITLWNENRPPRTREIAQWNAWMDMGYDAALLCEAARAAQYAEDRLRYMNGVLAGWKRRGITTAQAAKDENQRRQAAAPQMAYDKPADYYRDYFDQVEELE